MRCTKRIVSIDYTEADTRQGTGKWMQRTLKSRMRRRRAAVDMMAGEGYQRGDEMRSEARVRGRAGRKSKKPSLEAGLTRSFRFRSEALCVDDPER